MTFYLLMIYETETDRHRSAIVNAHMWESNWPSVSQFLSSDFVLPRHTPMMTQIFASTFVSMMDVCVHADIWLFKGGNVSRHSCEKAGAVAPILWTRKIQKAAHGWFFQHSPFWRQVSSNSLRDTTSAIVRLRLGVALFLLGHFYYH